MQWTFKNIILNLCLVFYENCIIDDSRLLSRKYYSRFTLHFFTRFHDDQTIFLTIKNPKLPEFFFKALSFLPKYIFWVLAHRVLKKDLLIISLFIFSRVCIKMGGKEPQKIFHFAHEEMKFLVLEIKEQEFKKESGVLYPIY